MKNSITEIKNTLQRTKSRLEKVENNHKKKFRKTTNIWRLKNILLKNE